MSASSASSRDVREIVLSDGVFCCVRKPIYLDAVACKQGTVGCPELFLAAFISKLCLFDGEPRTMDEVLHMDASDVSLIAAQVNAFLYGSVPQAAGA